MIAWLAAIAAAVSPAPADAPGRLQEIRAAISGGRLIQAELMLQQSPPASPDEKRLLADLRLAQKRYAEAADLFINLQSIAPSDPYPASRAGIALLQLGRTAEAEFRLRAAVVLPGADWRAWNALGVVLDRKAAWQESRACYDRALRLAPREPTIFNNAGYSLILQRNGPEARALLLKARKLDRADKQIKVNLEIADAMAGAVPDVRTAQESDADWAARLNNAGYGAFLAGNLIGARSLFARAIEASSTRYDTAERNLAEVERMLHR